MKVLQIQNFLPQKIYISPKQNDNKAVNEQKRSSLPSVFLGRDLVSFASRNFSETLDENYFKLKEGNKPDKFQKEAGYYLNADNNVLVVAPTGTGKTAIAHYAISKNLHENKKTFYTTPLKALSNQKYKEFCEVYGKENVGILTGDRRENPDAPVVIMTTEVFRNMVLSDHFGDKQDMMKNVGTVIFDEFHYLGDIDRGPVWEEAVMYTPDDVQMLALSATVGNAEQLQNWINTLSSKETKLVSVPSENRHVPLRFQTFETDDLRAEKKHNEIKHGNSSGSKNDKATVFDFRDLTNRLKVQDRLPAIYFVFSKKFSGRLVEFLGKKGPDLTTDDEKKEIKEILAKYKAEKYIGNNLNEKSLLKGYAMHNAGIMPNQKELIEELFQKKLVKVVVATETLAAGINMPAKTVALSSCKKPTGQTVTKSENPKEDEQNSRVRTLSANEFHQMAGRAGRRGIDEVGYVYVMPTTTKAEKIYDKLIKSPPEAIESQLSPDYAFLANFYRYAHSPKLLEDSLNKSFYAFKPSNDNFENKPVEAAKQKTAVMLDRGFLIKDDDRYYLTPIGELLTTMKGNAQLPLVESVYNRDFEGFSPETLAAVAAAIVNTADKIENNDCNSFGDNININALYGDMQKTLKEKLPFFDKQLSDFSSSGEVISFLNTLKMPQESISELNEKRRLYSKQFKKMNILKDENDYPDIQKVAQALKNGQTVPLKSMEECKKEIEEYEKKFKYTTCEARLEKLNQQIKKTELNSDKSCSRNMRKKYKAEIDKLNDETNYIKSVLFLKETLPQSIDLAYRFINSQDINLLGANAKKYDNLYNYAYNLKTLRIAANGCSGIEKYLTNHDIVKEDEQNQAMISRGMRKLINNTMQIEGVKRKNELVEEPDIYNRKALQIVYNWAQLNKINSDSQSNWEELVWDTTLHDNKIDEGQVFRIISQTIDLLNRISELADNGITIAQNQEEKEYFQNLKQTTQKSVKLLKRDPVVFD